MCDPARLEVVRRAKVAKTDPIDARRMVRALVAGDRGEAGALARVRIPTPDEEDAKRLMRHRERLVRTRVRLHNTIRGLLRLHGIAGLAPGVADFDARLPHLRTPLGTPLPEGIRWEIDSLRAQLAVVTDQLAAIESAKAERVAPATRPDGTPSAEATLVQLVGIGANDATLLGAEGVDRDVRNRRERASWAGWVAAAGASGTVARDQGISKAGTPRVRTHRTPMAGRGVRSPPDSPIPQGVHAACAAQHGRARTRALVAVARKRVIAPSLDRGAVCHERPGPDRGRPLGRWRRPGGCVIDSYLGRPPWGGTGTKMDPRLRERRIPERGIRVTGPDTTPAPEPDPG